MKCPKCHYLSFEPEPRCRNCGYDLLEPMPDLTMKASTEPDGPLADFELQPASVAEARNAAAASVAVADPPAPPPSQSAPPSATPGPWPPVTSELPLFLQTRSKPADPDEPLVKVPASPRQPLGVRRTTPDPARTRAKYQREPEPDRAPEPLRLTSRDLLDIDAQADQVGGDDVVRAVRSKLAAGAVDLPPAPVPVGAARRLEAAAIDGLFLGAIDVALLWLTLRACDLTFTQAAQLPMLPVAAFLFLLNAGYLLMFTATNGQTVGKMAAHIRVIAEEGEPASSHVTIGQAATRALLTIPSVLVLGLGFIPALVGEGRALHDRIAHTRVVRA